VLNFKKIDYLFSHYIKITQLKPIMTTKTTKMINGAKTTFTWEDGYWVQQEEGTFEDYYDEDECRKLLNRLNRGAEMMAFGIKNAKGMTSYMPLHFAKVHMVSFYAFGKRYSQLAECKNDPNGFDAYFVIRDYATKIWVQKTGENIGRLTDNDELQLIKALGKASEYNSGVGVKNRRGR
jgi:hypothetical protein